MRGAGFKGKAHNAEGKALENSDISDLPAFTLCAMHYALCPMPRNSQPVTRNSQPATETIDECRMTND